ncbi:Dak phosphatase [Fictibacillus macauensis ZFHKF-1]|uniref:Dak phosphatase n=1 Tax=Fictibacillus macauensis ZFHKF-1 TaxID=1196324 RepID=I8UDS1_9BACL|nr:DAK2 domain-containing protein [Fictibacillus macauensis]EIT85045.1 Dak phosphatase [Fictibacillus macauensis ZFHKF-1]
MSLTKLDGKKFAEMVEKGAANLSKHAAMIDALNVFPVPDGDTGTNMNLTITSGAKEVKQHVHTEIGKVAQAFSRGLLMGARGNSGVILSQLFRGFAKSVETKVEVNAAQLAKALENGVETAYKAVMKPVEGTILTVAKEAAKAAAKATKSSNDILYVMNEVVKEAKIALDHTPELLPVLKEVGVVDSGGQGLLTVYEGFLLALEGKALPDVSLQAPSMSDLVNAEHHKAQAHMKTEDIHYGYCTEFMVKLEKEKLQTSPFQEMAFRQELDQHGDSLLVVADEGLVKVHIHTEAPGDMLTLAQQFGSLVNIKIENMREQHTAILNEERDKPVASPPSTEKSRYGIVTVAMGAGVKSLLQSLGATSVIEGGQTMNPSTEDIVKAIEEANAEEVIILPNNSNIIMAAEQAATVVQQKTAIIRSKNVPQGMAALLAFQTAATLEENEQRMTNALSSVKSGQVTSAVRDTTIDGVTVTKGDFIGILNGKIVTSLAQKDGTVQALLAQMLDEDSEIVTLLTGEDATKQEVEQLLVFMEETYPDVEVEVYEGGQPLYPYILAVE